jgi:hypothetical protein
VSVPGRLTIDLRRDASDEQTVTRSR